MLSLSFFEKLLIIVVGFVSEGIRLLNILPVLDKKFPTLQLEVQFLLQMLEILSFFNSVNFHATKENVF